jgi:hypothetical protein
MVKLVKGVATGRRGHPPSTVLVLSGDVHHGYLAEADLRGTRTLSRVYQAVCSPLRNSLPDEKSRLQAVAWNGAALAARLLSRLAGVREPGMDWRLTHEEPFFDNQVAALELDGPAATITFEGAVLDSSKEPNLRTLYRRRLA